MCVCVVGFCRMHEAERQLDPHVQYEMLPQWRTPRNVARLCDHPSVMTIMLSGEHYARHDIRHQLLPWCNNDRGVFRFLLLILALVMCGINNTSLSC